MNKQTLIILIVSIVLAIAVFVIVYMVMENKENKSQTGSGKTVQDQVNEATVGEISEATKMINSFYTNINDRFTENMCQEMLVYSDPQLAWAATFYDEKVGRTLKQDVKDMPYLGWTSISTDDNELIKRLETLGFK